LDFQSLFFTGAFPSCGASEALLPALTGNDVPGKGQPDRLRAKKHQFVALSLRCLLAFFHQPARVAPWI
jgi:hypothetical protein